MGIRLGSVYLQLGIIHNDYLVGAVLGQFVSQSLHLITDKHCHNLCLQLCSQLLAFSQQFIRNTADLIVYLLGKYIYTFIVLEDNISIHG